MMLTGRPPRLTLTSVAERGIPTFYGAEWWEAAAAIGTVGATVVALLLAYRSWQAQKNTAHG